MNYDDFKDTPKSIGELRADKDDRASAWTPREALVSLLREIDNGETQVDVLFIAVSSLDGANSKTGWRCAGRDGLTIRGCLARALYMFDQGDA